MNMPVGSPSLHHSPAQGTVTGQLNYLTGIDKSQSKSGVTSAPVKIIPNMPFSEDGIQIELNVRGGKGFFGPPKEENLVITTGNAADKVHIKKSNDGGLIADINGKSYEIPLYQDERSRQKIEIHTNGGDDDVSVADDLELPVSVKLGDGNDRFKAGGGRTNVYGGAGNDTLTLGAGVAYAEGDDGDDSITAGLGYSVMYGGNGNDKLRGGSGGSYMDGGRGNDLLEGGSGHNVMHGGRDDDVLIGGKGRNIFYSGRGLDTINSVSDVDSIYAKDGDGIKRTFGSQFKIVSPTEVGSKAFNVEGTEEFKQRFNDDLEFLQSSPTGQKMLGALDNTPERIKVVQQPEGEGAFYNYGRKGVDAGDPRQEPPNDWAHGYINDGIPGAPADDATILFDPSFVVEEHKRPPIIPLFHEMGHAYNGVNGTALAGETFVGADQADPDRPQFESNRERQAVGQPTNAPPFDFDNDPSTPPTNTNPAWATENGLADELGTSLRERYFAR